MNSITLPRASVEQALAALEAGTDVDPIFAGETEAALRAALAQEQAEPAQAISECIAVLRPMVKGKFPHEQALDELVGYTAPPQRDALLQALQNLVFVCQRMDLEHQAERPSEAEYQATMQAAQEAIHAVEGGA